MLFYVLKKIWFVFVSIWKFFFGTSKRQLTTLMVVVVFACVGGGYLGVRALNKLFNTEAEQAKSVVVETPALTLAELAELGYSCGGFGPGWSTQINDYVYWCNNTGAGGIFDNDEYAIYVAYTKSTPTEWVLLDDLAQVP